jgi:hypothetical protein
MATNMRAWLLLFLSALSVAADLRISVYATAGDVQRYLASTGGPERVAAAVRPLGVTRIFLEGRRGDEYVAPELLRSLRTQLRERGIEAAGGIATVPGKQFAARQEGELAWLNWESAKTRGDVANFFRENAPVFDEIVVDDFYCTGDISAESEKARGGRSWAEHRQALMTSLIDPLIVRPARDANPHVRLILKYPQWYDRFHMFGYAPGRMSGAFDRIWVGTEVRNPETRRMGFVQPTEGYMNFRWISSVAGAKVEGAWFDHIECTAQNLVDQAWQSVLAGAQELTFFHLGDVMEGHPGHALFRDQLPAMRQTAAAIQGKAPRGIAFYKPSGSEPGENMYLMDYMGMLGLPVAPSAAYPDKARVVMLGLQAAADDAVMEKAAATLRSGGTVIFTPAALRKLGASAQELAGVRVAAEEQVGTSGHGLEIDTDLQATSASAALQETVAGRRYPLLLSRKAAGGQVLVWNVRTFTEQDFRDAGEWLLAPKQLALTSLQREAADELRRLLMAPLGLRFSAPVRVALYDFGDRRCVYNFRTEGVDVNLAGKSLKIAANSCSCE